MSLLKILLTLPLFLWFYLRLISKYRARKNPKKVFNEEKNYYWVKSYSKYLFWIYNYKVQSSDISLWDTKPSFIIGNKIHFIYPLLLIKKNDFGVNPPIIFLFEKAFFRSLPKILFKFYSLINVFVFDLKKDSPNSFVSECVSQIQIPRSVFVFLPILETDKWIDLLNIAYGGFAQVLFFKFDLKIKKICLELKRVFLPNQIIKLNKKILISQLKNV